MLKKFFPGIAINITCRHGNRFDANLMAGLRNINGVLQKNNRIVVCERNTAATILFSRASNRLRAGFVLKFIKSARFADILVLAKLTHQITISGAERKNRRSWQKMIQRLLFYRINTETTRSPIGR